MTKLFIVKHHPIKEGVKFGFSKAECEAALDLAREVEEPIRFDSASFYRAEDARHAVESAKLSIYGENWPTTAREFTDEEYKKTFEQSADRKIEWLGEALDLGLADASKLFGNMTNKKLNILVNALAGKSIPAISYK